ncbi:hypothetical protein V8E54_002871 [Elaphomyces granulatus]
MKSPYPIRSPLNPNGGSNKDYSYTSPLSASGSDYPCKGYANDPFVSVANYTAGGSYQIELDGSATHGGGSCQISLSYDKAKTFNVIKSMEGGCPLTPQYSFTIPSDAPSGQALLAWTWFNKVGNREMYMNCAQVTINGKSSKRSHPRELSHKLMARDSTFSSRPTIFLANINNPEGQCTTVADQEVAFPLPGPDVQGSVSGQGYVCKSPAPFLSGSSSSSNSESSSGASPSGTPSSGTPSSSASSGSGSSSSTSSKHPSVSPVSENDSSNNANSTPASTPLSSPTAVTPSPEASPPAPSTTPSTSGTTKNPASNGSAGSCTEGQITCSSDGNSFSLCSNGSLVPMGNVASGTTCKNGGIAKL